MSQWPLWKVASRDSWQLATWSGAEWEPWSLRRLSLDCPEMSQTVLVCPGLSWTVPDCPGLSWSVPDGCELWRPGWRQSLCPKFCTGIHLSCNDPMAHRASMARDKLGGAVDHQARAPLDGLAEVRGRHCVVDNHRHPRRRREIAKSLWAGGGGWLLLAGWSGCRVPRLGISALNAAGGLAWLSASGVGAQNSRQAAQVIGGMRGGWIRGD